MKKAAQDEISCLGVMIHTYAVSDREMIIRRRGLGSFSQHGRWPTVDICLIQNPPQPLPPIGGVDAIRLLRIPYCICINKQTDVAEHRRRRVALSAGG